MKLGEFDRYLPFFHLPHVLETFEGRTLIETPQEMRFAFDHVLSGLRDIRVEEMVRICTIAQFDGPHTIRGCHDTRLLGADKTLRDAYSGLGTLRLIDGQWLVTESQFAEETASLPSLTLRNYSQNLAPRIVATGQ